ncbi:MAG: QcrA and Rieske domain-containing protein [Bacteroidia bacterium]
MDRRKFLKATCALCAVGIGSQVVLLESCKKNTTSNSSPQGPTVNFSLDLTQSSNASLNTAGGSVASNGVVVANTGSGYVAVAQSCTHAGCSVGYNKSGNNFVCPCHNGVYDTGGKVVSGPPPAPLKSYNVTKNANSLTISG